MKVSTGHTTKIWAIRVGDFVEIRQAHSLKKIVSKLSKELPQRRDPYWGDTLDPSKVIIETVNFTGGEVLGYLKLATFYRKFKFTPEKGSAYKLTRLQSARIMRVKKWQ